MINLGLLSNLESQYNLPPGLLNAVAMQESGGNPNAVSPAGAEGLFQFMPKTSQSYGIDPYNQDQAADGAARMFSDLSRQYNGDMSKMLAGYNWGSGNIARKGMENAPAETRNYIARIQGQLNQQKDPRMMTTQELEALVAGEEPAAASAAENNTGARPADFSKMSDAELEAIVNGGETVADTAPAPQNSQISATQDPTLTQRFGANYDARMGDISKLADQAVAGDISKPEALARSGLKMAQLLPDAAGSIIAEVTPDFIKEPLTNAVTAAANTDTGRAVTGAINDFNQNHPVASGRIGSALDAVNLLAPFKPVAGKSAINATADAVETASKVAGKQALKVAAPVGEKALDVVAPRIDTATAQLAKRAEEFGIPLRLDQLSPTRARKNLQKVSQDLPFSGSNAFEDTQRGAWNKAVANTLGVDDLSPVGVNQFLDNTDQVYKNALNGQTINTNGMVTKLDTIVADAKNNVANEIVDIIKNNVDGVKDNIANGVIDGPKLSSVRSVLVGRLKTADSKAKPFISNAIEAIDEAVEGSVGKDVAQQLTDVRRQWRNYKTMEPLLESATDGQINPTQLMQKVAASKFIKSSRSATGNDDLVDLARIGKQFMPKAGGSDTVSKSILGLGTTGLLGTALTNPGLAAVAGIKGAGILGANRLLQSGYNTAQPITRFAVQRSLPKVAQQTETKLLSELIKKPSSVQLAIPAPERPMISTSNGLRRMTDEEMAAAQSQRFADASVSMTPDVRLAQQARATSENIPLRGQSSLGRIAAEHANIPFNEANAARLYNAPVEYTPEQVRQIMARSNTGRALNASEALSNQQKQQQISEMFRMLEQENVIGLLNNSAQKFNDSGIQPGLLGELLMQSVNKKAK